MTPSSANERVAELASQSCTDARVAEQKSLCHLAHSLIEIHTDRQPGVQLWLEQLDSGRFRRHTCLLGPSQSARRCSGAHARALPSFRARETTIFAAPTLDRRQSGGWTFTPDPRAGIRLCEHQGAGRHRQECDVDSVRRASERRRAGETRKGNHCRKPSSSAIGKSSAAVDLLRKKTQRVPRLRFPTCTATPTRASRLSTKMNGVAKKAMQYACCS